MARNDQKIITQNEQETGMAKDKQKSCAPNQRCVKNKWVFKIKHNDVYWVHLIACRYSQVPGIDFSKNYSPVVNNVTFCILLLVVLILAIWLK